LIGAIIGDIVGSRFEFNNHRSKDFELFSKDCFVTDDSIISLAVAKAIMEAEKIKEPLINEYEHDLEFYALIRELAVKYMQEIGRKYPDCGYGGMFAKWVFSEDPKPYDSFGNGAAMRVSPAAFAARTETEAILLAKAITDVTHNSEEGIKGAEATAVAIFMARSGFAKREIREKINRLYYPLNFDIDGIRDTYRFDETCPKTVPQAIEAFLESSSFEDAIRTAISLGGDSDTIAAIAGAIAEAYYGVPMKIRERALAYLDEELRAIYDEWVAFAGLDDEFGQINYEYDDEEILIKKLTLHLERNHVIEEEKDEPEFNWHYSEIFTVDHEKQQLTLKQTMGSECVVSHIYEVRDGVDGIIFAVQDCLDDQDWLDTEKLSDTTGVCFYELSAEYYDGSIVTHHGVYNRSGMPEKMWMELIESIEDFLVFYGMSELLNKNKFLNARKPGEVKYCNVVFEELGKTYYYQTDDGGIEIGDTVVVPVGTKNNERTGIVTEIEYFTRKNLPLSLKRAKNIIKRG